MLSDLVQNHGMIISGAILLIAYIFIATEKIQKSVVALVGASLTMILGLLPFHGKISPETGNYIRSVFDYIEFEVIFLLIGMMIIVGICERSGMFQFVAIWAAKKVDANPRGLLAVLAIVTAVFSAFLDNVTTVLLIAPVTFQITRKLKVNPYPFLVLEIFASNIGGTATLIGDPPNILIGSALDLTFMDFVKVLTPIVLVVMLVLIALFDLIWGRRMITTDDEKALVLNMNEKDAIIDRGLLYKSLFVLALVIGGFIFAKQLYLDNCTIALTGAALLLLLYTLEAKGDEKDDRVREIFSVVDWTTIFFFTGLFVIVFGLEETGILSYLGQKFIDFTGGSVNKLVFLILWSSAILSSVVDNIPFVATMIPMLKSIEADIGGREAMMPVWWALSLGACFGGNGTLIGASANVVVAGMASKEGHPINFIGFLLWSIPTMLLSVGIATLFMYIEFLR